MTDWKFEHEGLTITTSRIGAKANVVWQGISDSRSPGAFLSATVQRISECVRGAEVVVDFTNLEYVNSATVAPMIGLIKTLDAEERPIRVVFSDVEWQRTHYNCMSTISRTLKNVRVEIRRHVSVSSLSKARQ